MKYAQLLTKRLSCIRPVLFIGVAVLTSMTAQAQLTTDCPSHIYLGNDPSGDGPDWSEEAQGLANDGEYWFFTHREGMIKYSKNWHAVDGDDPGKLASTGLDDLPPELSQLVGPFRVGINHFGDPDHYAGYIFVPLEGNAVHKAVIAAYRASDLKLVDWVDVTAWQTQAGWLSIHRQEQALYTSGNSLSANNPLLRYSLELSFIENETQGDFLTPISPVQVSEIDGSAVSGVFTYMQGGVFTPWGDLYISAGEANDSPEDTRGGLHLFRRDTDGQFLKLIQSSVNVSNEVGTGVFAYEYHPEWSMYQEPEGIDWWNQDNDPNARYEGQLHAILLSNDLSDDEIWLKHYEVNYFCMLDQDSDGDGISDGDEVYVYNTDPLVVDWPVSDAGGPYEAECAGATTKVSLDGAGSSDPEGGELTYAWTSTCPGASFDDSTSTTPTLTVDTVPGCAVVCDVELVVTDEEGSSSAPGTASVTIRDNKDPMISCPTDVAIECSASSDPGNTGYAIASDICDSDPDVTWSDSETPGSCLQAKIIARTWTATDYCDHDSSCEQQITVADTAAPVLSPQPADFTVECNEVVPLPPTVTAMDNCDTDVPVTYSEVRTDGSCPSNYELTRTWTATDDCGNSATHVQTITVQDTTPPVISCNAADAITPKDVPVSYTATATDNCGIPSVSLTGYDCVSKKSRSKLESCMVGLEAATITILDSGGVETQISWSVEADDGCGNVSNATCSLEVLNPGQNK